eukprot:9096452-Pyramimonas_sp.AAC.2
MLQLSHAFLMTTPPLAPQLCTHGSCHSTTPRTPLVIQSLYPPRLLAHTWLPVGRFEKHVGSFTTLRYVNRLNEGFRETEDEVLVAKWSGSLSKSPREPAHQPKAPSHNTAGPHCTVNHPKWSGFGEITVATWIYYHLRSITHRRGLHDSSYTLVVLVHLIDAVASSNTAVQALLTF